MSADPVILVEDLHKRFGSREILRGISFAVNPGETLAVLGRSGTGKSVTLKILVGLLNPTRGSARIFGKELYALPKRERFGILREIGYVFQGSALFDSLTILENVGFSLYQSRVPDQEILERVTERLKMVGLGHTLNQNPSELSGGMRKRAALARAIIDLPKVVFYDEPTTGLDPLTTDVINQIILRLRSLLGVTSIVVTHDIRSAFTIADRIIMLDQGRIVAQGTPQDIEANDLPWVQHFIAGQALEGEAIDSGAFTGVGRLSRGRSVSARRIATRGGEVTGSRRIPTRGGEATGSRRASTRGGTEAAGASGLHSMPPPIRHRRRSETGSRGDTDGGEAEAGATTRSTRTFAVEAIDIEEPTAPTPDPDTADEGDAGEDR